MHHAVLSVFTVVILTACSALPVTTSDNVPSTMQAAHVGSTPCSKPYFHCIEMETVKVPTPLPGEALVRVNVSSVNPSDVDIVEGSFGKLFGKLGADFSGQVVSVGPLCSKLEVGDAVWGVTLHSYAEYVIVICALTSKLGDTNPRDVGTLPEVSLTSAQALKKTGAPWDKAKNLTVVITSGSGGTGFVAIQLAKAYGAGTVITAAGGDAGVAFCKAYGADIVSDYHVSDIWSTLANNSVDVVYDNYGSPGTADKAMDSLKPTGTFIFLPGKGGNLSPHPKPGVKQINYGLMVPSPSLLDELHALYQGGKLRAHVEQSYPLTNVSGAFAQSAAGHVKGKLAIQM